MMHAVIILPTYDERENIENLVPILEEKIFPRITTHKMSILVADDSSPDGTGQAVDKLSKKYKNLHLLTGKKEGLGAAYLRAMEYAVEKLDADILFEMDADGQHDEEKIPEFLQKIDDGYDLVIGTRYSGGGSIPQNWPPQRKLFSITANLLVRTIFMRFNIHDWTGGFRALKKEVFLKEKDRLQNFNGYIFQIAFLHKAVGDGFKIGEVPFHFTDRKLGQSKIAPLGYIFDVLYFVVTARIKEQARFIKFLFVGGTGFIVQLIAQEFSARVIFASFMQASLRDGFSAGIGAEAAIISNFLLNNFWTFSDTKKIEQSSNFFMKLITFNLASFASILIQFISIFIFVHFLGENMVIGSFVIKTRIVVLFPTIIFLVIPLNYLIYNKIIWKTQYLKK